jgi:hypothetical protein
MVTSIITHKQFNKKKGGLFKCLVTEQKVISCIHIPVSLRIRKLANKL